MKTKTISPLAPPHTINMVHMGMVDRHDIVTIARQTHIMCQLKGPFVCQKYI